MVDSRKHEVEVSKVQYDYWFYKGTLQAPDCYEGFVGLNGVIVTITKSEFLDFEKKELNTIPRNLKEIAMHENYHELWGEFDI